MSTIHDRGDNPAGLATFDPMRHENYRKAVRAISDRFHRLKGIPPLPRFEDRQPLLSSEGKVVRNQQGPAR